MNAEKSFRKFLRANFKARMTRDAEGHHFTTVHGRTATAQLQNVDTVIENLRAKGKIMKETNRSMTFEYQDGRKGPKAEITVSLTGDHVLKMVSKQ